MRRTKALILFSFPAPLCLFLSDSKSLFHLSAYLYLTVVLKLYRRDSNIFPFSPKYLTLYPFLSHNASSIAFNFPPFLRVISIGSFMIILHFLFHLIHLPFLLNNLSVFFVRYRFSIRTVKGTPYCL